MAQHYDPESTSWNRLDENRYAEGWGSSPTATGRSADPSEAFTNAYMPSAGLAVFLRGRAFEKGDGVAGVRRVKDSVARASSGPRLRAIRPENSKVHVGEWGCYRLDVEDVPGSLNLSAISNFKLRDEAIGKEVPRKVDLMSREGVATFRVCTPVSPLYRKEGFAVESLTLQSDAGPTTFCNASEDGASLSCLEGAWNASGAAPPMRTVPVRSPRVADARGDMRGPEIATLDFDRKRRVVRIEASDESGLGITVLFASEDDGVTRMASEWNGDGSGFALWPGDKGASRRGTLEIPVKAFESRGGVVLRGGFVHDTIGNATAFGFRATDQVGRYLCRSDGSGPCELAKGILSWLETED